MSEKFPSYECIWCGKFAYRLCVECKRRVCIDCLNDQSLCLTCGESEEPADAEEFINRGAGVIVGG